MTIYTQTTSSGGFSNWNNNAATDNYAGQFTATATGVPNQLVIVAHTITGTPTGDFFIRNQNTASGATTYASATGVTLSSGTNTISLTGGTTMTSGNTYYLWFGRTSNASNFPSFDGDYTTGNYYKSTAANADPSAFWQNLSIKMTINGNPPPNGNMLAVL